MVYFLLRFTSKESGDRFTIPCHLDFQTNSELKKYCQKVEDQRADFMESSGYRVQSVIEEEPMNSKVPVPLYVVNTIRIK